LFFKGFIILKKDSEIIYTTNANWVSAIYDTLEDAGIDAKTLFKQFHIPLEVHDQPNLRVDVLKVKRLWQHVTATTGNDAISLQVTHHVKNTGGMLNVLGGASENLIDAVDKMAKFISAATTGINVSTQISDDFYIEVHETATGVYVGDEAMDAIMARITYMVSQVTTPAITPLRIELKRSPPACLEGFKKTLNCPLLFSQKNNRIFFSLQAARQPFNTHNLSLAFHLEQYLKDYIEKQIPKDTSNSLIKDIFYHLGKMLPAGDSSMLVLAQRMNMNQRTLQRKLKEQGVTYQELLNKLRLDLACHYLKQNETSVEAISDLLGFATYTSFIRFFKIATGSTPKEFIK